MSKRKIQKGREASASFRHFEVWPMVPGFNIECVRERLNPGITKATAVVKERVNQEIVVDLTGQKNYCCFSYQAYIELLTA